MDKKVVITGAILIVLFWAGVLIGSFIPFFDTVDQFTPQGYFYSSTVPTGFGWGYIVTYIVIAIITILWMVDEDRKRK